MFEHSPEKLPSNRKFGWFFCAFFIGAGLWPLRMGLDHSPRWVLIGIGASFGIAAVVWPAILAPLNRAWFLLGLILGRVTTPIITFILYWTSVVPFGVLARLLGKDSLHRKFDPTTESYWVVRKPPGIDPSSFKLEY
jgi:hypothetical protein